MTEDPIVAEVHRARKKLAAECNYDIPTFFTGLRKRQLLSRNQANPTPEADRDHYSGPPESPSSEAAPAG